MMSARSRSSSPLGPPLDGHAQHRHAGLGGQAGLRLAHASLAQGGGHRGGVVGQLGQFALAQFGVGGDHGLALAGQVPAELAEHGGGGVESTGNGVEGAVGCRGAPATPATIRSWRRADPPKSTSRLSAKCRKKVRSVSPARAAICAAVVWSNPRSEYRARAASCSRPRLSGCHRPMTSILALTVTDIRSRLMAVTDINVFPEVPS